MCAVLLCIIFSALVSGVELKPPLEQSQEGMSNLVPNRNRCEMGHQERRRYQFDSDRSAFAQILIDRQISFRNEFNFVDVSGKLLSLNSRHAGDAFSGGFSPRIGNNIKELSGVSILNFLDRVVNGIREITRRAARVHVGLFHLRGSCISEVDSVCFHFIGCFTGGLFPIGKHSIADSASSTSTSIFWVKLFDFCAFFIAFGSPSTAIWLSFTMTESERLNL